MDNYKINRPYAIQRETNLSSLLDFFKIVYGHSAIKAEREGTNHTIALFKTMLDIYNNGLEALCVPLPHGVRDEPLRNQYFPPLVYARNTGNRNRQKKKLKKRKGGKGWFDMNNGQKK